MIILHKEMTIFPEDWFIVFKPSPKFGNISDAILSVSFNNEFDSTKGANWNQAILAVYQSFSV